MPRTGSVPVSQWPPESGAAGSRNMCQDIIHYIYIVKLYIYMLYMIIYYIYYIYFIYMYYTWFHLNGNQVCVISTLFQINLLPSRHTSKLSIQTSGLKRRRFSPLVTRSLGGGVFERICMWARKPIQWTLFFRLASICMLTEIQYDSQIWIWLIRRIWSVFVSVYIHIYIYIIKVFVCVMFWLVAEGKINPTDRWVMNRLNRLHSWTCFSKVPIPSHYVCSS